MSNYKLFYFNARGRAEVSRFILAQAGVDYEDKRLTGEEFVKLKPSLPTGMLPVLEVDGKAMAGSGPIIRFLAEENNLGGSGSLERLQIGGIVDVIDDLLKKLGPALFGNDEAVKEVAKKALIAEHIPKYFGILEKIIATNNSTDGWVFGNKVTYADFCIATTASGMFKYQLAQTETYPNVKKCTDSVNALPKIAEWIKKRPETEF